MDLSPQLSAWWAIVGPAVLAAVVSGLFAVRKSRADSAGVLVGASTDVVVLLRTELHNQRQRIEHLEAEHAHKDQAIAALTHRVGRLEDVCRERGYDPDTINGHN